jgi:hypothetical protein
MDSVKFSTRQTRQVCDDMSVSYYSMNPEKSDEAVHVRYSRAS